MKLLRTIINIYQKQVIKKQVLNEAVLVKTLIYATIRLWIWKAASFPTI